MHEDLLPAPKLSAGSKRGKKTLVPMPESNLNPAGWLQAVGSQHN